VDEIKVSQGKSNSMKLQVSEKEVDILTRRTTVSFLKAIELLIKYSPVSTK
jgi:hypothetical protein